MEIKDYIRSIEYSYIETYSLLRGEKNEVFYKDLLDEIEDLKRLIKEPKLGWFRQTKRLAELEKYVNRTQNIFTSDNNFHPTSERRSIIIKDQKESLLLDIALCTEYDERDDFAMSCIPTYRDALVFYDNNNQIIDALNICFRCKQMYSCKQDVISAHHRNYQNLAKILRKLGHEI